MTQEEAIDYCLGLDPRIERTLKRIMNSYSAYFRGIISEEAHLALTQEEAERGAGYLRELLTRPEVRRILGECDNV